jgi:hypothetical protein
MNDYYLLEERLKELSHRRKILDRKAEMRQSTLSQFDRLKETNTNLLQEELERSNQEARLRNQRFLQHMNITIDTLAACRNRNGAGGGSLQVLGEDGALKPPSHLALSERKLKEAIGMWRFLHNNLCFY